jgi:hypothetical protein
VNKLPRRIVDDSFMQLNPSVKWNLNDILKALNLRGIECSVGIDSKTSDTCTSFNLRYRKKDAALVRNLLRTLYGTSNQN